MIWVHCGSGDEVPFCLSLASRLAEASDVAGVLLTAEPEVLEMIGRLPRGVELAPVPADTASKVRAFWEDRAPRYLIWVGGTLRPVLLRWIEKLHLPAVLVNARTAGLHGKGSRWLPRAGRTAVAAFDRILTADGATATRLMRSGVPADRVQVTGPLLEEALPLRHDANELTVMAEALDNRPMWFAADIVSQEVMHMIAAHLVASRRNHRLLLIVTPRDCTTGPQVAETLREAGLIVGVRSEGDDPTEEQQVYVADLEGEIGLWYRIAPLTFIGGTLSGGGATSPFDAAVLGSAVVHGTRKAPHDARFARLAQAEASREVRSASELGVAVGALIAPEQTARLALAGWEELTRNAETLNTLVRDALHAIEDAA
ncbi:3-deoxy-D-manno-octulosonic acid transferase [Thalassorhabdomicrobium marinisediminis]|uniref:3-deoxy-D-manno-octulosonic acid transferase n=1 Tax=Thalassorhabdomicrobium marinisediminis TaxID=2170577 RepID=A0A2T7G049_9RHOB|nr:glycosyltransferase N-terminal domain-containing protein [Thalassorhabdomicrobium marinisediminis]PVA07802.1 3-deoxy-manno-octulosonate cytidylyltransferase [Thalassorhabdomicrobium marinisediminis]